MELAGTKMCRGRRGVCHSPAVMGGFSFIVRGNSGVGGLPNVISQMAEEALADNLYLIAPFLLHQQLLLFAKSRF